MDSVSLYEENLKKLIKERIGNNCVEDIVLNFENGRLAFYIHTDYVSRTGKKSKKWFEIGVLVFEDAWIDAFKKHGINSDVFDLYMARIVEACELQFGYGVATPLSEYYIPTPKMSLNITPYKRIDCYDDLDQRQWWNELSCDEPEFGEKLAIHIKETE